MRLARAPDRSVAKPGRAGALRAVHAGGHRLPACSARPATCSTARSSGARTGSISSASALKQQPSTYQRSNDHGSIHRSHRQGRLHLSRLRGRAGGQAQGRRRRACRRSSASTRTSARWPTATRPTGYLAVAPATFHRVKQGVELGYTEDDMKAGFALKMAVEALPAPGVLQDIAGGRRLRGARPARSASSATAGAAC